MLHDFVGKVVLFFMFEHALFLWTNFLYLTSAISTISVKMHLTKCHDDCYVLHDAVSLLHSIVYPQLHLITPFAYQICVGKFMPLSAMFVNCDVI